MRILSLVVFLLQGSAPAESPLDQLAWLGGCWQSSSGERVIEEMWLRPVGGLMIGAGRTTVGGQARSYEHLRLRAEGEVLVYTAIPSGQTETHFRSTAVSASGFAVENRSHDFPQRIAYTMTGTDAFTARVEGPGSNGATRGFDIMFRRVACASEGGSGPP
jgi:hypothetical protein